MSTTKSANRTIASASFVLLFGGLVLDLSTSQELVVAIIYNVPIVLSAPAMSRRLTTSIILLAIAGNATTGYVNFVVADGIDRVTVANRLLVGLSLLLVGAMTLLFERRSEDVKDLISAEEEVERSEALRRMTVSLSRPLSPDELLAAAADELRTLLAAEAVVISGLAEDRFAEPRWSSPEFTAVAEAGRHASWALDVLPVTATPVTTTRSESGVTSVGRLHCGNQGDLIVIVDRPQTPQASNLLSEALLALTVLRDRSAEIERLRMAAGES